MVPDYTNARCLLQFNRYHKYTVDEHCIRSVGEATRLGERNDTVGDVYRKLKRKWLLHLVLLIHDLGKGQTGDHSVIGADIARRIGERLHLAPEDTKLAASLVRKHLLMSHAALWHDTSDPAYVRKFTGQIESLEELEMLYALSCADLAAVGPGVLNDWKVGVLGELYRRAKALLTEVPEDEQRSRRATAKQAIWQLLPPAEQSDPWFEQYFRAMPESFVTSVEPAAVAQTLQSLRQLQAMSPAPPRAGISANRKRWSLPPA